MTDKNGTGPDKVKASKGQRGDRLAGELRDNLKRRKGQLRSRGDATPPGMASRKARSTLIKPD